MKILFIIILLFNFPLYSADVTEFVLAPAETGFWMVSPKLATGSNGKILAIWLKHPGTHQGREIYGSSGSPEAVKTGFQAASSLSGLALPVNPNFHEYLVVYSDGQIFNDPSGGVTLLKVQFPK